MMKHIIRETAAALAALLLCTGMPCGAATIETPEAAEQFYQQFPIVYQNGDTVWRSNAQEIGKSTLYFTEEAPCAEISCAVRLPGLSRYALNELVTQAVGESGTVSLDCGIYSEKESGKTEAVRIVHVRGTSLSAETADRLYDTLNSAAVLYQYSYQPEVTEYMGLAMNSTLCWYDFRFSQDETAFGKLTALIEAEYPGWEVQPQDGISASVRMKDGAFETALTADYLAMEDAIAEKLGIGAVRAVYPEPIVISTECRHYLEPDGEISPQLLFGDVNESGDVNIKDVMAALQAAGDLSIGLEPKLTAGQLLHADADGDGEVTVKDALCLLIYYGNTNSGIACDWRSITGNPLAPDYSNL